MTKLRCAALLATTLLLLSACSSGENQEIVPAPQNQTPTTAQAETIPSTSVNTATSPAFWADSIRIDGPKIAKFSQDELEQQVIECKPDISQLTVELDVDQTGWNYEYVDADIYSDQYFDSAQQAWDDNEIFYFSYNFLGPYKGDFRQQIEIMIGAWKPIGETSRLSEVKQYALMFKESEYVYQLSPENNFAMVIAYGTEQVGLFPEPIPLGKIGLVETLLMQLVDCAIPYFVSNE